jgi:hypothetical protein
MASRWSGEVGNDPRELFARLHCSSDVIIGHRGTHGHVVTDVRLMNNRSITNHFPFTCRSGDKNRVLRAVGSRSLDKSKI